MIKSKEGRFYIRQNYSGFSFRFPFHSLSLVFLSLRPTLCRPEGSLSLSAGPSERQGLVLLSKLQYRLVSLMPFYAVSQNLWWPGCFQFKGCVNNAHAFSSDHEAPLVGKTLSHPPNTSEKDFITSHNYTDRLYYTI